jgi:hypothetical protein
MTQESAAAGGEGVRLAVRLILDLNPIGCSFRPTLRKLKFALVVAVVERQARPSFRLQPPSLRTGSMRGLHICTSNSERNQCLRDALSHSAVFSCHVYPIKSMAAMLKLPI